MMPVYLSAAFGTLSSQYNITDNGDILIKGNASFAGCAMRGRDNNRLLQGNTMDQDIEKAAQGSSQGSYDNGNYGSQGSFSLPGIAG